MTSGKLQTVIETPEFMKQAKTCMDDVSKERLIEFIAQNPEAGDLISGTGGVRKVRWQSHSHQGKRGGVRVIYYWLDKDFPIFLFTAYGKNQKETLSMEEKHQLRKVVKCIVETYRGENDE